MVLSRSWASAPSSPHVSQSEAAKIRLAEFNWNILVRIQSAVAADLRPDPRDRGYHENGSNAAGHDGEQRAAPVRDEAGFKATEFVGSADEKAVHGGDAAPFFI